MKRTTLLILLLSAGATIASAQTDFQKTSKGTMYHLYTHNTGDKVKVNDVITFNMVQKTDKDSVLASTYKNGEPLKAQVQDNAPLMDVFEMMTVKDSALVKVPTDSIFVGHEDQRPPFLPKGSNLFFVLKVERVQTLQAAIAERDSALAKVKSNEGAQAAKYIADNHLTLTTTPSGLKYQITQVTQKRKALKGDTVQVNYTGRFLDGKIFDTNIEAEAAKAGIKQDGRPYGPIDVVVGTQMVIPGWDEGLALLHEGESAKFVIPSSLAYGDKGQGEIGPYQTLVFDLQIVKVKPAKHIVAPVKKPVGKAPVKKAPAKS